MIFSRKKPGTSPAGSQAVLRGRENADNNGNNPLARRFHPDDEPDTVDLENPGRFHAAPESDADSPTTRYQEEAPDQAEQDADGQPAGRSKLVTQDPETGKFHIHPGIGDEPVLLGGEPVLSVTELRPGDKIRIGAAEFHFIHHE